MGVSGSSSSSHDSSSDDGDEDESLPEFDGLETRAQLEGAAGLEPTADERRDEGADQS